MTKSKGGKKPNKQHKANNKPKDDIEKNNTPSLPNGKEKHNDLLKEILNLGGSKDDLKLVEDIDDIDTDELQTDAAAPQVMVFPFNILA